MKVAVIGLGSMGKRRIRLIQKYSSSIVVFGVDLQSERCKDVKEQFNIETYSSVEQLIRFHTLDCAFITTSPLSHGKIINQCLELGLQVFSELNLVDDMYEENLAIARRNNLVLFLSSTFLYRKEIEYIDHIIQNKTEPLRYQYHVGQYLPDWHPWEDYKTFFVANVRTNACREIFAIELPWICRVFGEIESISVEKSKITNLEIDYPDNYSIYIKHTTGYQGTLQVDIVSRIAERKLRIMGENTYITWNGKPDSLCIMDIENKKLQPIELYTSIDKIEGYSDNIIEDAYYSEVENFFKVIENGEEPKYSFEEDLKILNLIDTIEK